LELAREWGEFKVTERAVGMKEVVKANDEGRVSLIDPAPPLPLSSSHPSFPFRALNCSFLVASHSTPSPLSSVPPPFFPQLLEAFGAGTAVVVCPIKGILYQGKEVSFIKEGEQVGPLTIRVWDALTDIQVIHGPPPSLPPSLPPFLPRSLHNFILLVITPPSLPSPLLPPPTLPFLSMARLTMPGVS